MPEFDRQQVEERLDERMRQIEARRQELRRNGEGLTEELADYDQHPADQGTETFEQELDETTLAILDSEAKDVAEAQKRLEEGTYGICIDGGEEIPIERLEAIPEALRCIDHQRIYDAQLRARGGPLL